MNYIFDIDGTLWDTTEVVAVAWNDAIEDVGLRDELGRFVTGDMLKQEFGKPMDVIVDDLFPGQDQDMKERIQTCVKIHEQSAVGDCEEDLAYPEIRAVIRTLAGRSESITYDKGTGQTEMQSKASDIGKEPGNRVYIVSNCQAGYIELVMNKLGIRDCVTDHECFGVTGFTKADNIRLVCERNGIDMKDAVYIGDTAGDYDSAMEAGVGFIYAAYGFGPEKPVPGYTGPVINNPLDLLRGVTG